MKARNIGPLVYDDLCCDHASQLFTDISITKRRLQTLEAICSLCYKEGWNIEKSEAKQENWKGWPLDGS